MDFFFACVNVTSVPGQKAGSKPRMEKFVSKRLGEVNRITQNLLQKTV